MTANEDGAVPNEVRLGAGRSGVVYRAVDEHGREIARKVFAAHDRGSNLVHYVFTGAPNPYRWSEAAIHCAALRRQIMAPLLRFWFGDRLAVANAYGHGWNEAASAWELRCELVSGGHLPLRQPFSPASDLLPDMRKDVIARLQEHLIEAGFDGLVWQAGRGNPVALNNFMLLPDSAKPHPRIGSEAVRDRKGFSSDSIREERANTDLACPGDRWVWIDLESGVPALIPINPIDLFSFYLPRSFHHGRPLFDDTDIAKLRSYVNAQREELEVLLGVREVVELSSRVDELERSQNRWRTQPRFQRSIAYRSSRGFISKEEAAYYNAHRLRWYTRESVRATRVISGKVLRLPVKIIGLIARVPFWRWFMLLISMIVSQKYRASVARDYVTSRSESWRDRGQLSQSEHDRLCAQMNEQEASSYLTDFGMHLAVKPFVKLIQYALIPVLLAVGWVTVEQSVVALAFGGAIARTVYTLLRIVQNVFTGRERPWLALFVGLFPIVGNLAFPLQVVYSSRKQGALVARFILFDSFTRFGTIFPIWGGEDTLTEHLFNRIPSRMPAIDKHAVER